MQAFQMITVAPYIQWRATARARTDHQRSVMQRALMAIRRFIDGVVEYCCRGGVAHDFVEALFAARCVLPLSCATPDNPSTATSSTSNNKNKKTKKPKKNHRAAAAKLFHVALRTRRRLYLAYPNRTLVPDMHKLMSHLTALAPTDDAQPHVSRALDEIVSDSLTLEARSTTADDTALQLLLAVHQQILVSRSIRTPSHSVFLVLCDEITRRLHATCEKLSLPTRIFVPGHAQLCGLVVLMRTDPQFVWPFADHHDSSSKLLVRISAMCAELAAEFVVLSPSARRTAMASLRRVVECHPRWLWYARLVIASLSAALAPMSQDDDDGAMGRMLASAQAAMDLLAWYHNSSMAQDDGVDVGAWLNALLAKCTLSFMRLAAVRFDKEDDDDDVNDNDGVDDGVGVIVDHCRACPGGVSVLLRYAVGVWLLRVLWAEQVDSSASLSSLSMSVPSTMAPLPSTLTATPASITSVALEALVQTYSVCSTDGNGNSQDDEHDAELSNVEALMHVARVCWTTRHEFARCLSAQEQRQQHDDDDDTKSGLRVPVGSILSDMAAMALERAQRDLSSASLRVSSSSSSSAARCVQLQSALDMFKKPQTKKS
eukprot:TRINITY_DN62904_c0_g2_i1.p1 TRINITY_DN62904_c0_g2~~TRINITY_DN62904_c0_g2_i1.p1  ORF type:complete len:691 (-),score=260.89 TRINITY_DN62904_c0_g2_i1:1392-3191(-)